MAFVFDNRNSVSVTYPTYSLQTASFIGLLTRRAIQALAYMHDLCVLTLGATSAGGLVTNDVELRVKVNAHFSGDTT